MKNGVGAAEPRQRCHAVLWKMRYAHFPQHSMTSGGECRRWSPDSTSCAWRNLGALRISPILLERLLEGIQHILIGDDDAEFAIFIERSCRNVL